MQHSNNNHSTPSFRHSPSRRLQLRLFRQINHDMAEQIAGEKRKRSPSPPSLESDKPNKQRALDGAKRNEQSLVFDPIHAAVMINEELVDSDKSALREHIGADSAEEERQSITTVLFFVEITPPSRWGGSPCNLSTCTENIEQNSYRIAVYPSKKSSRVLGRYG